MDSKDYAGHRMRLRERFIKAGLEAFSTHEVLEFLLFYAIPRRDTKGIARKAIKEYGGLAELLEASPEDIMRRTGLTENTAVFLSLMPQLAKRYQLEKNTETIKLEDSHRLREYTKVLFIGAIVECFYIICMDANYNLRAAEMVFEGDIHEIPMYPRKILERVLAHRTVNLVLAHNHPSGNKTIPTVDFETTKTLAKILEPFNVTIVDHIIVAGDDAVSFAEKGYIKKIYK
ncbi:MAG: hypothetical protein FWB98_02215 [Defluviitaleaceae bacterium]|nr:hypothetical protein [Defluviitaleaceae bacterium]